MSNPHLYIRFDVTGMSPEQRTALVEAEKQLAKAGIEFDSSTELDGPECSVAIAKEWQWDQSLTGPITLSVGRGAIA